ncbi:MAG: DUF134 domain-containing protein [Oscillospiraceae bacterium]|nr:DUF134 domain-containing protein [Oscillospiraceae bacterium]
MPLDLCGLFPDPVQAELLDRAESEGCGEFYRFSVADLLNFAIKNELTKEEQEAVYNYRFKNLSGTEASKKMGIHTRAFYRLLGKAEKKLYSSLKYAVVMRTGRTEIINRKGIWQEK